MTTIRHVIGVIALVVLVACTPNAASPAAKPPTGQPKTAADIAMYEGADRQAVLEAGARAEGSLMLYTSGVDAWVKPLLDAFSAKYPYIKTDSFRADNADLIPRIIQEYQAGRYAFDVLETTTDSTSVLKQANALESFRSPELANYPKDALDQDSMFAPVRESYVGLGYNTALVTAGDAPKTLDDLLDPRWKGRLAIAGSSTGVRFVGNVMVAKGADFLKKLGDRQIRVQNISGRALADLVVSGEVPLSPTIFDSHVADSRSKGAPIAWLPLEPTVVNLGAVSIASHAPHPNAAMLFLDFALSQDGQALYRKAGYASARTGMGGTSTTFKKRYLEHDVTDYPASFAEWQHLLTQTFVKTD